MTSPLDLSPLGEWTATRDALQAYAKVLGAIRRETNEPHPRWWHVSLQPLRSGLTTGPLGNPERAVQIDLDLTRHEVRLIVDGKATAAYPLGSATPTEVGDGLLGHLESLGLPASPPPERWKRDESPAYDPGAAMRYLTTLVTVADVFREVQASLPGERSPVQLWPHHFDLSFEWFSDKTVTHEEDGETTESPAQIGFGFSTGDETHPGAYFYANPWEFDESLLQHELPGRAKWITEGFQGSILSYDDVNSVPGLAAYLRRVYELAAPTLS